MLLESSREHFTILIIIFLVWSETKSALVVMFPQLYCLFTVRKSHLSSVFVPSGDWTKISGSMTQVLGEMTLSEMTVEAIWYYQLRW